MNRAKASSLRQLSWCFALALSLLFSQFSGFKHRIDHTRWRSDVSLTQNIEASSSRYSGGYTDANHSCIALDAISLADCIAGTLMGFIPTITKATRVALASCYLWDASFIAHFRSRAPPSLL
ncbi:MAG: hypothetical protein Q7R66_02135 [Undibacterium sp.]|uniref:hypothetical protein n=1 Tax=Undibacterium sp. TaxID=1914977 RepID=UPI0027274E6C|nr:hypothetical protein [Undibacterium sp.]MDO8650971.1 hypothetical protein [Undibacterium sp.]